MSSLYLPSAGNIIVSEDVSQIRKLWLPNAPRRFVRGCPMWDNKANGVEPCLLSPTAAGNLATAASGTTYKSTYSTQLAFNAAFAPLFAGFAAEDRFPQQLASPALYSVQGAAVQYADDASRPFMPVYTEGAAIAPCAALAAQHEEGEFVAVCAFANEATTGFYDPSGCLQQDTDYYGYMNQVTLGANADSSGAAVVAADAIGILCERALIGQTYLKFKFKSAILAARLGGV